MMTRARYEAAPDFEAYLEGVDAHRELWHGIASRITLPPEVVEPLPRLDRPWHLLALSEDWCGDAVNLLPLVAALAAATPGLDLRVLGRDSNPDLMDAHLTQGTSRSIPVVILFDDDFVERGWWGPRPGPLQTWVRGEGALLSSEDRYREIRRWYARDRGRTTWAELTELIERGIAEVAGGATPVVAGGER